MQVADAGEPAAGVGANSGLHIYGRASPDKVFARHNDQDASFHAGNSLEGGIKPASLAQLVRNLAPKMLVKPGYRICG